VAGIDSSFFVASGAYCDSLQKSIKEGTR